MAVLIFKAFQRLCMIGEDQNGKYGLFDGTFSSICIHFPPQKPLWILFWNMTKTKETAANDGLK